MRLPPSQVLTLRTPMLTLLIGPMHALGAVRLVLVLTGRTNTAADRSGRLALDFIRRDATQIGLLRAYLVAAAIPGSIGPRTDAAIGDALLDALRNGRLGAVAIGPPQTVQKRLVAQPAMIFCVMPNPVPHAGGPAAFRPASPPPLDLTGWSTSRRLEEWIHRILPLLGPELARQVRSLLDPANLALMVTGLVLLAGLQAVGVGEVADAAFLALAYAAAGWSGLVALVHLAEAARQAAGATDAATLDRAATKGAAAITTLGIDFLSAVVLRMAKRNTSGGGTASGGAADASPAAETVNSNRGSGVGRGVAMPNPPPPPPPPPPPADVPPAPAMPLSQAVGDDNAARWIAKGKSNLAETPVSGAEDLTDDQIGAIHGYTTDEGYMMINPALRGQTTMTPELQGFADQATSGLDTLPATGATTYRGVDLPPDVLSQYQVGQTVADPGFFSTALDPTKALDGSVNMQVDGVSGRNIAPFSDFSESEILFKPNTPFTVLNRVDNPDGSTFLHLQEAPQ